MGKSWSKDGTDSFYLLPWALNAHCVALRIPASIPGLTGGHRSPIDTMGQDGAIKYTIYHSEPLAISTCMELCVALKLMFFVLWFAIFSCYTLQTSNWTSVPFL